VYKRQVAGVWFLKTTMGQPKCPMWFLFSQTNCQADRAKKERERKAAVPWAKLEE
jgi:hypothetical protein